MRTRPARGVQDVRTRSSLTSETEHPHRKFLRVASLELRRTLCRKVREAALKRVGEMEAQMSRIESEEAQLLAAGGVAARGLPHAVPPPHQPHDAPATRGRSFTLKY
ncbi:MAG: hypothetical protein ABSG86_24995 [Thermoguttaceae bacterium]|jgi:hypothetical protein